TGLSVGQAVELARARGVKIEIEGAGRAVRQVPAPGRALKSITCHVTFDPGENTAMRLRDLIQAPPAARAIAGAPIEGGQVRDGSRAGAPGDVCGAVGGGTVGGHAFAPAAADKGAAAVVVEAPVDVDVPQVVVPSGVRALGWLAARAAGRPTDRMRMIAVTGTNGKTTTTYLLESILPAAGCSPGAFGQVSFRYRGKDTPA